MCRSPSPRSSGQRSPNLKKGSAEFRRTACLCLSARPVTSPSRKVGQRSDGGKGVRRLVFPFARSQLVPMGREKGSAQVGAGLPSLSGPDDPAQPGDTGHLPLQHPLFKEGVSARGPGVPTQEVVERPPPPREDRLLIGSTEQSPPGTGRGMESPRSGTDRVGGELGAPSRGGRLGSGVLQLALGEPWEGCPRSVEGSSPRPGTGRAPRLRADAAEEGGARQQSRTPPPPPGQTALIRLAAPAATPTRPAPPSPGGFPGGLGQPPSLEPPERRGLRRPGQ